MIKLLLYGEILWDIFINTKNDEVDEYKVGGANAPLTDVSENRYKIGGANAPLTDVSENRYKIGGAVYNLAAHAVKLGAEAYLVSAVGEDVIGENALVKLRSGGINSEYVVKNRLPTGYCEVRLNSGSPSYNLADNVAYDFIPTSGIDGCFDALCFGTLALRHPHNRCSLAMLLQNARFGDVYFDINIRTETPPALIDECLKSTTILKASREEMIFLGCGDDNPERVCEILSERYPKLRIVLITLDSDGALAYECGSAKFYYSHKPTGHCVSAVGAGDSFGACFLYNIKNGIAVQDLLNRAVILSDFVVTRLEAVPDYPDGLIELLK